MDDHRFLPLFLRHERELAGIARAYLPDWDAVDEVIQESSLVMWRKIDELQSDDDFVKWAQVIIRFEVLKYRRNHARRRWLLDDELVSQLMDESTDEEISNHGLAAENRSKAVRECLGAFSDDHQRLLLAPYTDDESVKALANRGGHSVNALYKRLGRLRSKLHDCVTEKLRHPGLA
ncbi:sigma-70 family RNA polymerase sigma factor [Rhodopirellula sp. JC740]|uniref:Sigma-70 family RNA polymerase sigma factor n=1 Tax=Rhodopirellula halodulae TaxID=2894198 RepID=A0ABS8NNK4_9BACT|nr:sigma-70 family RNA polymerase sigma factor [Rhodopirellula sp. JC740]MCC9644368.1 sigma-70 family RNA polymerase sigma factor [Rhodopirellula sp. JC740]